MTSLAPRVSPSVPLLKIESLYHGSIICFFHRTLLLNLQQGIPKTLELGVDLNCFKT